MLRLFWTEFSVDKSSDTLSQSEKCFFVVSPDEVDGEKRWKNFKKLSYIHLNHFLLIAKSRETTK